MNPSEKKEGKRWKFLSTKLAIALFLLIYQREQLLYLFSFSTELSLLFLSGACIFNQQFILLSNISIKYFIRKLVAFLICLVHIQLQWLLLFYVKMLVTFQSALNFSSCKAKIFYGISIDTTDSRDWNSVPLYSFPFLRSGSFSPISTGVVRKGGDRDGWW